MRFTHENSSPKDIYCFYRSKYSVVVIPEPEELRQLGIRKG